MKNDVISKAQFSHLQEFVDGVIVPSDVGRIPHKIDSQDSQVLQLINTRIGLHCSRFLHSYGILPQEHLECWRRFVLACRFLCKRSLTMADVDLSDLLLLQFGKHVQDIFGEEAVTPNIHMHTHIKEVILDYGPVYAWLFSYERYNGILGNQQTNNRAVEPHLMNCFVKDNFACSFQFPSEFHGIGRF